MEAKELRKGNYVQDVVSGEWMIIDEIGENIGAVIINRDKYPLPEGWQMGPIPLTPEILEKAGFYQLPHFTVNNGWHLDIGRDRVITVACVGTPNEMIFLCEEDKPKVKNINVLRNFDYDGKTYLHQLQNIVHSITSKELKIEL